MPRHATTQLIPSRSPMISSLLLLAAAFPALALLPLALARAAGFNLS